MLFYRNIDFGFFFINPPGIETFRVQKSEPTGCFLFTFQKPMSHILSNFAYKLLLLNDLDHGSNILDFIEISFSSFLHCCEEKWF